MDALLDVLRVNEIVVYFVYGQVFFVLGLVVALRARESRKRSQLALAGYLGWLAGFGITHALNEWGGVFIPIQAVYLPPSAVAALRAVQCGLLALSYLLLMQFGILVTLPSSGWRRALRLAPPGVIVGGLAVFLALGGALDPPGLARLEVWIRRLLALPGAAIAGYGMFRQANLVVNLGLRQIARHFRVAAVSLGAYAVFASVAVPPPDALAGQWPSYQLVVDVFGIPILVLRSLAGLGMAVGISWGLEVFDVETNRLLEEAGRRRVKEEVRRQLLKQAIAAQEEERRRVARELHDETGQGLTAVIMGLGAAREILDRDPLRTRDILDETRELAVLTLQGVRQLILGLRPASLDDLGLLPALRRLADDLARRAGVEVQIDGGGLNRRLPAEVETVLFRIVQEGLNNVGWHAAARHATLRLDLVGQEVQALLEDDGVGFDVAEVIACPKNGRGLGLLGMQERAGLLGGEVLVESAPGRGTRILVRLPVGLPVGESAEEHAAELVEDQLDDVSTQESR